MADVERRRDDRSSDDNARPKRYGAVIEGGVDAVVLGATLDGLAAAAYLARAGLKTVLIESGVRIVDVERKEFAPGFYADDADDLVRTLDAAVVNELDYYRFGLAFAERRMSSAYFFEDGSSVRLEGDLNRAGDAVERLGDGLGARFEALSTRALDDARRLRGFFDEGAPVSAGDERLAWIMTASAEALAAGLGEPRLQAIALAEAVARGAVRPDAPLSALALLRRWSGETAGLQGATAAPAGGVRGLADAARRAAQSAGVDVRGVAAPVRVLVEWDRVAGVEFSDGGQIRAPCVVTALAADTAFAEHIGRAALDIEFARLLERPAPSLAWAAVDFAFEAPPDDPRIMENIRNRTIWAPNLMTLKRAFGAARAGRAPSDGLMELFFPSEFADGLAPPKSMTGRAFFGPAPTPRKTAGGPTVDPQWADSIAEAALGALRRLSPETRERVAAARATPLAAAEPMLRAVRRAEALTRASGIGGYFFCGPEAQLGEPLCGGAGRRAAAAAIRYARRRPEAAA